MASICARRRATSATRSQSLKVNVMHGAFQSDPNSRNELFQKPATT
jgi:hypothetical protein